MRALAWLAAALAVLAGALAAAAWLFLSRPDLLVSARWAGPAARLAAASENPAWSELALSARALAPGRHRYEARAKDLCFSDRARGVDACFDTVDVSVIVSYFRWGARLERVERLTLLGRTLRADLTRRPPAASPAPRAFPPAVPASVRSLKWDALDVDLPSVTIVDSSGTTTGRFSARAVPGRPRPLAVAADFTRRTARGARRWRVEAGVGSDLLSSEHPIFLDAAGSARWGPDGRAEFAARADRDARGVRYLVVAATATAAGLRARGAGMARESGGKVTASGSAWIALSTGPVRRLALEDCRAEGRLRRGTLRPESVSAKCGYELQPARSAFGRFSPPPGAERLAGAVAAEADFREDPGRAPRFRARASATAGPVGDWYRLSVRAAGEVSGRLGAPLSALAVAHDARAELRVPSFERLVAVLRDTPYAVPAPFHVLKGSATLIVDASGDPRDETQTARYRLTASLKGRRQRLAAEASGSVTARDARSPNRAFDHDGTLTLQDVALELPRLDPADLPKLTPDSRVKAGGASAPARKKAAAPAPPAPPRVRGRLRVRTGKPVILFSNLAEEPVPVAGDLTAATPPSVVGGTVAVRRFDLRLFRRTATLDHLNIALKPGGRAADLEGLILYKTPSALIRISILGTTERPRIELSSVPPLRQEDIIAVLIFGKSPAELDLDQSATVGNAQTALEASAFGLASLYYFGITPIERVGYDPATKTYSVKLRLPGGVNLELGSDFDRSRGLTLRKFLAPHWAIQSEIGNQTDPAGSATTFLEWFRRY